MIGVNANWLKAIPALLQAFQKGKEVANPGAWKNVQVVASLIAAILSLFAAFGYDFGIGQSDILLIAGGVVGVGGAIITVITSQKVGFRQKAPTTELPPIDLIARPDGTYDRVRVQPVALPPIDPIQSAPIDPVYDENNGDGWGDR